MRFFSAIAMVFAMAFTTYAQDVKGYYILNSGERIEGYFKETDFTDSGNLEFKSGRVGSYSVVPSADIKEYAIGKAYKFVKYTVEYDTSSIFDDQLSKNAEPEWKQATVFLSAIAEGKASLYSYYNKGYRFFYAVDGSQPKQLIYKKYRKANGQTDTNEQFKNQLYDDLNCSKLKSYDYNNVLYQQTSLLKFIQEYNKCKGEETTVYDNRVRSSWRTHFSIYAGGALNYLGLKDRGNSVSATSETGFVAGFEAALSVTSGGWDIFGRVEYEKVSVENSVSRVQAVYTLINAYRYDSGIVSLYFGPRYNIAINDNNKLFIDAAFGLGMPLDDAEDIQRTVSASKSTELSSPYPTNTAAFGTFGVGYVFSHSLGLELRYKTGRNILSGASPKATLSSLGVNLKYTF